MNQCQESNFESMLSLRNRTGAEFDVDLLKVKKGQKKRLNAGVHDWISDLNSWIQREVAAISNQKNVNP